MAVKIESVTLRSLKNRRWWIVSIVLLGLLLRVWAAWQLPVDFDEPIYIDAGQKYAQLIQSGDINGIINFSDNNEHPPLVKIIYGITFLALGKGAMWNQALFITRLVSVGLGTLAVLVFALFDPLAGFMLAVQTLVVKYTSQAYLEALPLLMGLLAIILLRRSSGKWDKWFLLSALALGIMGAGKYSYFPIVFVVLYILIWEKHTRLLYLSIYFVVAGVTFFGFNPYLWHDPVARLMASLSFHAQYSQGTHVQEIAYPWYQPLLWVSRSWGFIWHTDVFFYFGFDGLIFLLALPGFWLELKNRRFVLVWVLSSMLVLLIWPTKWPQYTLVVLPAFCLAASLATKVGYQKLKEQELYWEWFRNMFPRPSRKYLIVGGSLLGLLVVGVLISQVLIAINRIGWSSISAETSGLPNNAVNSIHLLSDGRMLIGTDGGAAIWKAASADEVVDEWTIYNTTNSPLPNQRVLAVEQDQHGVYWFGTAAGLASFDGTMWNIYRAADMGLEKDQVNALAVDAKSHIWVGTLAGAAEYDQTAWISYTQQSSGLVDNAVFSLTIQPGAEKDIIWFGTLTGVSRYDPSNGQWQNYTRQDIDLGWGGVSHLLFDSSGKLWVCTEGGGISLWDGITWSSLRVSNSKLPYSTIESVAELEPGVFWIAASIPNTSGGVLARLAGSSWRVYQPSLSGYSGAETVTIAKDSTGRYWFGTRTHGIDLYQPRH
jgi:ligand-binding sensor domain-containing protein